MRYAQLFVIACVLAAAAPFVPSPQAVRPEKHAFPGWPTHFDGRTLAAMPLSEREQTFAQGFPGRMATFTDGERTILFRWVTKDTRKLHSAWDCFRGSGYRVTPLPLHKDEHGQLWGNFRATRGSETVHVSERISDDSGNAWTDVSAWYWAALLGQSNGPWWAVTVVRAGQGEE
jgi:hypothetical protein